MDITIGRPYIENGTEDIRLCSDIRFGDRSFQLWFSFNEGVRDLLITERCDPFVGVLLPEAMKRGMYITSETPISSTLLYQFREHLIPTMSAALKGFQDIRLEIPSVHEYSSKPSLTAGSYTLQDCEYPVDIYVVLRSGAYKDRNVFQDICEKCKGEADKYAFINSNIDEIFPESDPHSEYIRMLSSVLTLQKGISSFRFKRELLPFSDGWDNTFNVNREEWFSILVTSNFKTEDIAFYVDPGDDIDCCETPLKSSRDIVIGNPQISSGNGITRLTAEVRIENDVIPVWFEVSYEYGCYFTDDRLDPFVVPFLPKAMKEGRNIICKAPVSRRLLFQIRRYLIPGCSANMKSFDAVNVFADEADDIKENAGAVATGCTCGVDSMFTISRMLDSGIKGFDLTHFILVNCGALESDDNEETLRIMNKRISNGISKDTGLPVVCINSNLDRIFPGEIYLSVVVFRFTSMLIALQKLFGIYYFSSSFEYTSFCFDDNICEYYEEFLLPCLDLARTRFFSSGATYNRVSKVTSLSDFKYAQKYLHPCVYARRDTNCGKCGKCLPTITALYALGKLDSFGEVFDIEDFHKNTDNYIGRTIAEKHHHYDGESYRLLKEKGLITKRADQIGAMISAARTAAEKHRNELLNQSGEAGQ